MAPVVDRATGLVTDDWDGHARTGTADIGADEYSSTGLIPAGLPLGGTRVAPGNYTLSVYNVSGKRICALRRGFGSPAIGHVKWDGRDSRGSMTPSGVYWLVLQREGTTVTGKLVRLR